MSLSAEYYMLKNAAVQNLVLVRNKQIEQMCTYISNMGYTAALICGFAVSTYSDIAGDLTVGGQSSFDDDQLTGVFINEKTWIVLLGTTTALCVSAALHCIVFSMYLRMWAERLALRGPTGSITRSIKALQAKAKHVKIPFVLMLVFFTFELICSFWLLNIPFSKRLAMTLVVLLLGSLTALLLVQTYECFRITASESSLSERLRYSEGGGGGGGGGGRPRKSITSLHGTDDTSGYEDLLGDSLGLSNNNNRGTTRFGVNPTDPDIGITVMSDLTMSMDSFHRDFKEDRAKLEAMGATPGGTLGNGRRTCGVLEKRSTGGSGFASWQQRFFVLEAHEFVYYRTKEAYLNQEMPCKKKVFTLSGYEVIVTNDAYFSFSLCPVKGTAAENKRRWDFRAVTEADRLKWLRALIFACDDAEQGQERPGRDVDLAPGGRTARALSAHGGSYRSPLSPQHAIRVPTSDPVDGGGGGTAPAAAAAAAAAQQSTSKKAAQGSLV